MSADELAKLADLKERGILTEKEFENQKANILTPNTQRKGRGVWWKIPLGVLGLLMVIGMITEPSEAGFPSCDGDRSKAIVKNAIESNPTFKFITHKLFDLDDIKERSYDEKKPERTCQAKAFLNSGEKIIQYRLFQRNNSLFVEVNFL